MGRRTKVKAVIYARGDVEAIAQQIVECDELCRLRDYERVGVCHDAPGQTAGWDAAERMRRDGCQIVVASAEVLPDFLESVTGSLPGPREVHTPRPAARSQSPRHRRPRPTG
jgi:hypothetical protein